MWSQGWENSCVPSTPTPKTLTTEFILQGRGEPECYEYAPPVYCILLNIWKRWNLKWRRVRNSSLKILRSCHPGMVAPCPSGGWGPLLFELLTLVCGGCGALTLASLSNELPLEEAACLPASPWSTPCGVGGCVGGRAGTHLLPMCTTVHFQGCPPRPSVKWEQVSVSSRSVGDMSSHVRLAPCLPHRPDSRLSNHRRLGNGSQCTLSLISFNS